MIINQLNDIKSKTLFLKKDENQREIFIYNLKNVKLTGLSLYYPNILLHSDDQLYLPINEKTMSLKMGTIYEKNEMKFDYIKQDNITNIISEPVFFFIYNVDNYFHFVYDSLPYLISFLHLKKTKKNLKILINYSSKQKQQFYRFVTEFLELIGISTSDMIIPDESTVYNNTYISTSYTHGGLSNLPPRKEIYDFYKNITDIVLKKYNKLNNINYPDKIYISRRTWINKDLSNIGTNYTTRRKLINEDDIVNTLTNKFGFVEIFAENFTTIEKILYFNNAKIIVGSIGGGLCSVLFANPNTKLISIVSPYFLEINSRFKYSLDVVNTIYITDTYNIEKGKFKKYMRVKSKFKNIIGEIEEVYDDSILVSYTSGTNVGWNSQNNYNKIILKNNEVDILDNGLNSMWCVNFKCISVNL